MGIENTQYALSVNHIFMTSFMNEKIMMIILCDMNVTINFILPLNLSRSQLIHKTILYIMQYNVVV